MIPAALAVFPPVTTQHPAHILRRTGERTIAMSENQSPTGAPALDDFGLEPAPAAQTTTATDQQPREIPDKYRGKSIEDLIAMHQNAERRLSQQGNELGEMRRIADGLIGVVKPRENARTVERKPVTVDSLLSNPEQTLASSIEQSSVAQRVEQAAARIDNLEKSVAQRAFETRYSSWQQDLNDANFMDWVKKNPVRAQLASAAYQGNYEAAAGLWSLWEEAKGTQAPASPQPNRAVAAAKVARQGATADGTPPRTYSRAKLMELREKVQDGDPAAVAKWNDQGFQAALIQAYQEGRVK